MYQLDAVLGTPMNPVNLSTVTDLIQTIPLTSGWTWFSTNLELIPASINDVLNSISPVDDDYIKDQQNYAQYFTDSWLGTLTTMNNTTMYKIKLENSQHLEITGVLRDPLNTTINYFSGWDWLGFIPHVSMSVNQALSNRTNEAGDFIKNQNGYAFYVDSEIGWLGSLRFMNPGEGFMLQSNSSGTFTYPDYTIRSQEYPEYKEIVLCDTPDWSVNPQDFEYTASLTIEIELDGEPAPDGNYLIGAFVGEECRGTATAIPVLETYLYFLTVYSNTQNEEISFQIYDADEDEIINLNNTVPFLNDMVLGSPSSPYNLQIEFFSYSY
jgi:hypothetical protein